MPHPPNARNAPPPHPAYQTQSWQVQLNSLLSPLLATLTAGPLATPPVAPPAPRPRPCSASGISRDPDKLLQCRCRRRRCPRPRRRPRHPSVHARQHTHDVSGSDHRLRARNSSEANCELKCWDLAAPAPARPARPQPFAAAASRVHAPFPQRTAVGSRPYAWAHRTQAPLHTPSLVWSYSFPLHATRPPISLGARRAARLPARGGCHPSRPHTRGARAGPPAACGQRRGAGSGQTRWLKPGPGSGEQQGTRVRQNAGLSAPCCPGSSTGAAPPQDQQQGASRVERNSAPAPPCPPAPPRSPPLPTPPPPAPARPLGAPGAAAP